MSAWLRAERMVEKAPPSAGASYGWGGGPSFADAFRFRRAPTLPALAEAYKSLIYTCVRLNSDAVSRVPLRLYRISSRRGDRATRCDATRVSKGVKHRLKSLAHTAKAMAGAEEVEEITGDFPLLRLIQNVNPAMDQAQLIQYTAMSLDVVGTAFWWPTEYRLGCPREFWPLPPHLVSPAMENGGLVPTGYFFGSTQYRSDELLIFKHLSMKNPYGLGMSPTQAAIEYARLEDTFVSLQDDLLSNGPRPSVIVSHKDPKGSFGAAERKRLEEDMERKGRGGRAGAAFVVDGAVSVTPVSWAPADLGAIEISKYDLERTCGCFGVPVSMVTNESSNLSVAREGLEQHARYAVEPRCKSIASTLTRWTHSLDKTGQRNWHKLFWAFDSCVPEDKRAEAEIHARYIAMGLPPNVALTEAGYDAVDDGDTSFLPTSLQALSRAAKPRREPEHDPDDIAATAPIASFEAHPDAEDREPPDNEEPDDGRRRRKRPARLRRRPGIPTLDDEKE